MLHPAHRCTLFSIICCQIVAGISIILILPHSLSCAAGSTLVSVPQVAALVCTPMQPPPKGQPELEAAWDGLPWWVETTHRA